jgi:hypothetical protein
MPWPVSSSAASVPATSGPVRGGASPISAAPAPTLTSSAIRSWAGIEAESRLLRSASWVSRRPVAPAVRAVAPTSSWTGMPNPVVDGVWTIRAIASERP